MGLLWTPCILFYPHGLSFDVCRIMHKMCWDTPYWYNPFFLPCPRSLETVCALFLDVPSEALQRVLSAAGVIAYLSTLAGSFSRITAVPCALFLLKASSFIKRTPRNPLVFHSRCVSRERTPSSRHVVCLKDAVPCFVILCERMRLVSVPLVPSGRQSSRIKGRVHTLHAESLLES